MPMTLEAWLALLIAPFVGSFLGVLVERLPAGRPVLLARSVCDRCGRTLGARDLVPVLSYVARQGRCGCGEARLGAFYPAIELAALAVALSAVAVLSGWLLWASLALGWTLLALAAIDLRHLLLPDALCLPLVPAGLAVAWAIDPALLSDHLLGALLGFVAFAAIALVYRRLRGRDGLGMGDAKLLAAAGAWLGWLALPSVVLIAAVAGLSLALAGALAGGKLAWSSRIAFGPHLALGLWLVWLFGPVVTP